MHDKRRLVGELVGSTIDDPIGEQKRLVRSGGIRGVQWRPVAAARSVGMTRRGARAHVKCRGKRRVFEGGVETTALCWEFLAFEIAVEGWPDWLIGRDRHEVLQVSRLYST